jgi:hypothetical protein
VAGKRDVTFSDAITAVKRWLWLEWVFAIPGHKPVFQKLSRPFRPCCCTPLPPLLEPPRTGRSQGKRGQR